MNVHSLKPVAQPLPFADVFTQVAAAVEILRNTVPARSGGGGTESFILTAATHGIDMELHLFDGHLVSLKLAAEVKPRRGSSRKTEEHMSEMYYY